MAAFAALAGAGIAAETHDLAAAGIVAPRHVVLTAERAQRTKPVIVFVQNRGTQAETIPDTAALAKLVTLTIEPTAEGAGLTPELVPPPKFPIVLRPGRKLAVVFSVTVDHAIQPAPGAPDFACSAKVDLGALGGAADAREANDSFPRKDDEVLIDVVLPASLAAGSASGTQAAQSSSAASTSTPSRRRSATRATSTRQANFIRLTADKMKVTIRKGQTRSDFILFTAVFVGGPRCFVSWDAGDAVMETETEFGDRNKNMRCQWDTPGDHVVEAYVYDFDDPDFANAPHKALTIKVLKVELQDENGNSPSGLAVGVTTASKDRSRSLKCIVQPESETGSVQVRVSKGGSNLALKDIQTGSGQITFKAEGTGTTGSKSKGDCTIEAVLDGKPADSADLTVVVPKKIISQSAGATGTENLIVNSGTTPSFAGVPTHEGVLITLHRQIVTVNVRDQFGDPIGDSRLYLDAPVSELFPGNTSAIPINRKILADSSYLDPVGLSIWRGYPGPAPRVLFLDPRNLLHTLNPNPAFALPNVTAAQSRTDTFQARVDGFTLQPSIVRTLTLSPGQNLTLTQTP